MKILVQRVLRANCKVNNETTGKINNGFLVFVGFHKNDGLDDLNYIIKKLNGLRIFENSEGKISYNCKDMGYSMLLIPQFTLYANTKKGFRPDFLAAMPPDKAKNMYHTFVKTMKNNEINIETGIFGADMKIDALNDGPFSIIIDSMDK